VIVGGLVGSGLTAVLGAEIGGYRPGSVSSASAAGTVWPASGESHLVAAY